VKQVPDTAAQIQIKPDGSGIVEEGLKYILNPYDEFAVEEAVRLKEKISSSELFVLTVGLERTKEILRTCIAVGADQAVLILEEGEPLDPFSTAELLAKKIESLHPDLILSGKQAADDDMAYIGGAVAQRLNFPFVSVVTQVEILENGKKAKIKRQIEGGEEIIEVDLPCVLSAQKGLNEPRYPSLAGMMKAKKKEIEVIKAADLVPDIRKFARTKLERLQPVPVRPAGKILQGSPEKMVKDLVRFLKDEEKVI
jgi:electron transfer flavoprotein beta subunit